MFFELFNILIRPVQVYAGGELRLNKTELDALDITNYWTELVVIIF